MKSYLQSILILGCYLFFTPIATAEFNIDSEVKATTSKRLLIAPPVFVNGPTATPVGPLSIEISVELDEPGTVYIVAVPAEAPAPTSAEVKAGTGSGGTGEQGAGFFVVTAANTETVGILTGLSPQSDFDIYVVAEDDQATPVIQSAPTLVMASTLTSQLVFSPQVNVASASPATTLSVTPQDANLKGVTFSPDGGLMFVTGDAGDKIYKYRLSKPFDVSSATYTGTSAGVGTEDPNPISLAFENAGNSLFVLGGSNATIYEYISDTPYMGSALGYTEVSLNVSTQEATPNDLEFSNDGFKLFVTGPTTDRVYEYTMSVAFDLSTASFSGNTLSLTTWGINPIGLAFNMAGTQLLIADNAVDRVFTFELSTAYDLTSASYTGVTYDISTQVTTPSDFFLSPDGRTMVLADASSNSLKSFRLDNNAYVETAANDGTLEGEMYIRIFGDTFTNVGSTLTGGTDYTFDNLVSGLTPSIQISANGLVATVKVTGTPESHEDIDDVEDLQITFASSAFTGNNVSQVSNANPGKSGLRMNFFDNPSEIRYSQSLPITAAHSPSAVFDHAGTDTNPVGMVYNLKGDRMYTVGITNDRIYEFTLSTLFDPSSASLTASLDISGQDANMMDIAIDQAGGRLLLIGQSSDKIYEYVMAIASDLSTATFSGKTLDISSEDTAPTGLTFDHTGSKLFILGITGDRVFEYDLSTPFDLATATYSGNSLNVGVQDGNGEGIIFNGDGTKLFLAGAASDRIYQYALSTPYDLTTAVYANLSLNVATEETTVRGMAFNDEGTAINIIGSSSDRIFEYVFSPLPFVESPENDGAAQGNMILNIFGDTFTSPGGTLTISTDYTITGVPTGLTPTIAVSTDGTVAQLSFNGNATSNEDIDDVSSLTFDFTNSALTGGDATTVNRAQSASIFLGINFFDKTKIIGYSSPIHISTGTADGPTLDVSGNDGIMTGMTFSKDGSKLFLVGVSNDRVYEYGLSTPFDPSTASFNTSFSIFAQESNMQSIAFDPSGSRMFLVGFDTDRIYEYLLEVPYDLTTAAFTGKSLSVSGQETSPRALQFDPAGDRLFVLGLNSDQVHQYNMSSPFDLLSATYSGTSFSVTAQSGNPEGLLFNSDGSKFFVADDGNDNIFQYEMSTPFDISSASYSGVLLLVSGLETSPRALAFNDNSTELFVIGIANDNVYRYFLSQDPFVEIAANDGAVEGEIIVDLCGDTFTNAGGTLTETTDYTLTGIPAGLTPNMSVAPDGKSAVLTLTGQATSNEDTDDVLDIIFTFNNSAFVGGDASAITGSTAVSSNLGINFFDETKVIGHSSPIHISTGTADGPTLDVSGNDGIMNGMTFSKDGSKLFLVGASNDQVYEYNLSTAFDPTTASFTASFSVIAQESNMQGIAFDPSGSRMFLVGLDTDRVYEYLLEVPYDLTTAAFTGKTLDISGQETSPRTITFDPGGDRMFILGVNTDQVYLYDLSTPFDLATAVYSGTSFSVTAQATSPEGLVFNSDGSKFFVIDDGSDRIFQYQMSAPFDISTASYTGVSLLVSGLEANPRTLAFNDNSTELFVLGISNDNVYRYFLSQDPFVEIAANDGAVEGEIIVDLCGDAFTNAGGTLTETTDYTLTGIPAGLTPTINVATDGKSAVLTLTGQATSNEDADDVLDIIFTFNNSAFVGGDASAISGSTAASSNLGINFFDQAKVLGYSSPVHLSTSMADGPTLAVGGNDGVMTGMEFSKDGSKLFLMGSFNDQVYEYNLSTAFDPTTASFTTSFSVIAQESNMQGIAFDPSGSRMFLVGLDTDRVYEYLLEVPYDLTTAAFTGKALDISGQETSPRTITFDPGGDRMFILGVNTDQVYQYDLSTPFDLATAAYSGTSFSVTAQATSPEGLVFNSDGSKFFVIDDGSDRIFQYQMSAPFDISTASYTGVSLLVSGLEADPRTLAFNDNSTELFVLGISNDNVYRYFLSQDPFVEIAANDGAVEGEIIVDLCGDTFTNAGGTLTETTDYTLTGIPAGLTPTMNVATDGKSAVLTLTGQATSNEDADDVLDIIFTFNNSAFVGGDASAITGSTAASSNLGINFFDGAKRLSYSSPIDITTASFNNSFDISTQDGSPTGVAFSPDGLTFYLAGNLSDDIFEFSLTTPYDLSTGVTFSTNLDLTNIETGVSDLVFDATGTRLFVIGESGDRVYEFILGNQFDLSTAAYSGKTLNVSGQDTSPQDILFTPDGSVLFMLGATNDRIYEYTLGVPFDITTASAGNSFSVGAQETSPNGAAFNNNGSELYVLGHATDLVHAYTLTTPFDITTASYTGNSFNVSAQEITPHDLVFNEQLDQLFIVGNGSDVVVTYDLTKTGFNEAAANDGTVEGSMTIALIGDTFTNAGSTLTQDTDFSVSNLPSGMGVDFQVAGDGTYASVSLTGVAFPSNDTEDVSGLIFSFVNSAFVGGDAASVANSSSTDSGVGIDFLQDVTPPTIAIDAIVDINVSATEATAVTVSGTTDAEDTQSVTLIFSDGSDTVIETPGVSGGTWSATSDISALAEGNIDITADVDDNAGNAATQAMTSLTLDKTNPAIAITTPIATDDIVDSDEAPTLLVSGATDAPDGQTVSLLYDDGSATVPAAATVTSGTWSATADVSTLANGSVTLTVDVNDEAGNNGVASHSFTLSLDSDPPVVSADAVATFDLSPELTGPVDDPTATISVTVDGQTVSATNNGDGTWTLSAGTLTDLNVGTYDVQVTGTDDAMNDSTVTVPEALVILPAAPTAQAGSGISVAGFTANWDAQPGGIEAYLVDVSAAPDFSTFVNSLENFSTTEVALAVASLDYGTDYYYRLRAKYQSSDTSDYSNTIVVRTATDPATSADSLALVALYQNTNGDGWTDNTNWLNARLPEWFGVTMTNARVTALQLPDNELKGTIPAINDALGELTTLDLSGNEITSIGNVDGLISLNLADVSENELQFGSLEQIVSLAQTTAVYSPQGQVLDSIRTLQEIGTTYTVDRTVTGSSNTYSWFKDGVAFENAGGTFDLDIQAFEDRGIFRVQVTNSLLPDLTLTTRVVAVGVSSLEQDQEALLLLYEATGGDQWTNGANWPNQADINDWEGVAVSGNRVTGLNLSGSNLTGSVPGELGDIVGLVNLNLSGNLIEELPDLSSLVNLTSMNVAGNFLDFGDLQPNKDIEGLTYSPQRNFGEEGFEERIPKDTDYSLSFNVGGSANSYQWSLQGRTFEGDIAGATASFFDISAIDYNKMGRYTLTVTNDTFPDLTLTSHPQTVLATTTVTFNPFYLDIDNELTPLDEGEARLMEITGTRRRFDSAFSATVVNEQLVFEDVVLGNFLMGIRTDTLLLRDKDGRTDSVQLLPTYYGGTFLWEEADTLYLRDAFTDDIQMQQRPRNVDLGDGVIDLLVESDFDEEGGKDAGKQLTRRKVKRAGCSLRRRRRATGGRPQNDDEFELIAYKETDDNGQVTFDNLPDGEYRLNIEYPGIPMDTTSYISFIIGGEGGLEQTSITLEATVDEEGIAVDLVEQLGILRSFFKDLNVYPNPADETMTIAYKKLIVGDIKVQLLNLSGGMVLEQDIRKGNNQQLDINVTAIPDGIYLLRFIRDSARDQGVITYKVVIAH